MGHPIGHEPGFEKIPGFGFVARPDHIRVITNADPLGHPPHLRAGTHGPVRRLLAQSQTTAQKNRQHVTVSVRPPARNIPKGHRKKGKAVLCRRDGPAGGAHRYLLGPRNIECCRKVATGGQRKTTDQNEKQADDRSPGRCVNQGCASPPNASWGRTSRYRGQRSRNRPHRPPDWDCLRSHVPRCRAAHGPVRRGT